MSSLGEYWKMTVKRKNPTLAQIAAKVGCSTATISYVLNGKGPENGISEETVQQVEKTLSQMGYMRNAVASSLRTQKSNVIGVIFLHLQNDFAHFAVKGIRSVLLPAGYFPRITTNDYCSDVEKREIQSLLERQVEAIICEPMLDKANYKEIQRYHKPLVFLGNKLDNMPNVSYVGMGHSCCYLSIYRILYFHRTKNGLR